MDSNEQTFTCACCGTADGQVHGDVVRRLHTVEIMSKFVAPRGEETSIVLCTVCISRMPFNIGPLIEEVNQYVDRSSADDAILIAFITKFITDVWPEDETPSTVVLCKMLNAVGMFTPRGQRWTYHNLNQRLVKLGLDKERIIRERVKSTFYARMQRLMQAVSEWTARQYAGVPIAGGQPDVDASPCEAPETWSPPAPAGMPMDMPGMGAPATK